MPCFQTSLFKIQKSTVWLVEDELITLCESGCFREKFFGDGYVFIMHKNQ